MELPAELPAAARRVIGRLARFPWIWDRLDEELQDFHAKKAHGTITVELGECYGDVRRVEVTIKRQARKA